MKYCKYCDTHKPLTEFHNCKKFPDGKTYKCKECAKKAAAKWNKENIERKAAKGHQWYEKNKELTKKRADIWMKNHPAYRRHVIAKRRANKKQATPSWANLEEIKYIYTLAQERGLEVDHIVPLVSDEVCGLHTPDNLRCITREWNRAKGNKHYPEQFGY